MVVHLSRKSCEYWISVLLIPVVVALLSVAVVAGSSWFQARLLDAHSANPVAALSVYSSLVDGAYVDVVEFTSLENAHMRDVESVFVLLRFVLLGFLVVVFGLGWYLRYDFESVLLWGGFLSLVLLALLAVFPFGIIFDGFHRVFFPQGNWQFPDDSVLLSYYPESYFVANAFWIGMVYVLLSLVVVALGCYLKRFNKSGSYLLSR